MPRLSDSSRCSISAGAQGFQGQLRRWSRDTFPVGYAARRLRARDRRTESQREAQHLDHYTLHMTVQPGAGGRLDVGEEMGAEGFRSEQQHVFPPVSMQANWAPVVARSGTGSIVVAPAGSVAGQLRPVHRCLAGGLSNAASGDRAALPPLDRRLGSGCPAGAERHSDRRSRGGNSG